MKRFFIFSFFLCFILLSANAQSGRNWDEEKIYIDELAAIDSSLVPDFIAGTKAMDSSLYEASSEHFRTVLEKAPEYTPAMRRLGFNEIMLEHTESAIALCDSAYKLDNSWESASMLANVYMNFKGDEQTMAMYLNRAILLLEETRNKNGAQDYTYSTLLAEATSRANDIVRYDREVKHMLQSYPDSLATHYYATLLYVYYQEWEEADAALTRAEELGLNAEAVNQLRDGTMVNELFFIHAKTTLQWVFIGWIIGLALLLLTGMVLSWITLRKVESQIANRAPLQTNGFRKVYRWIVNMAGVYYYLSLPLVLILLLIAVGGTIYLFLSLGRIPIYFFFMIVASGGVSIFYMLKTIFVRPKVVDEGRVLKEEEAPELFALSREVAADMNTRAVEEIRITPTVEMAVYERGSFRAKVQDKATRVLLIGTGILKDFKVEEFRSVLAHEYGHFSNRDTAGGSVAFRVRNDIHRYAYSLAISGQARWWNLAYQFLRLYNFIFRRISHGATRLQEILADRVAADMYGAKSFEGGLRHVIAMEVEFKFIAGAEVQDARNAKRTFNNLYSLPMRHAEKIQAKVKEEMDAVTTNDDTHPCPKDRFRYIAGITGNRMKQSSKLVTELFVDWSNITNEQTRIIEDGWRGKPAPGV